MYVTRHLILYHVFSGSIVQLLYFLKFSMDLKACNILLSNTCVFILIVAIRGVLTMVRQVGEKCS